MAITHNLRLFRRKSRGPKSLDVITVSEFASLIVSDFREAYKNFTYPVCIKRHVHKYGRSLGNATATAVDAHSHYDFALPLLANQRAAVVFLQ